ncbi:hypothetical protein [Thermomonospora amylolytica]|uniref:hypothetical protein n=1 Tax=Thermomonospora amylolytica TaxID=1411117 RepID=UPI000E6BD129|nr:hypothetical protein [Thermomonospora amylolytica]
MFHVHPRSQIAPLSVAAGKTSPLEPIDELVGTDAATGLDTMFIRVVKTGTGCAPTGPPDPGITLQADTGDPVEVPRLPDSASIFNAPGGTGAEVANATLQAEPDDIYLIRIFIFTRGSQWKIQIVNHDQTAAHAFTWTVADNDPETRQPWIDAPTSLAFDVEAGQTVTQRAQIANHGTGTLTVQDKEGTQPGPGFTLTAIPEEIEPNACGNLEVTFTGPDASGVSSAVYTVTSNDTTAQPTAGHNRQITLTATTRQQGLPPGTIIVAASHAFSPPEGGLVRGGVIRVDPRTGAQTKISFGGLIEKPFAVAIEADGTILLPDHDKICRVDPTTGAQTVLGPFDMLQGPHGLAVEPDGRILVTHSGPSIGEGGILRIDPKTGEQEVVAAVSSVIAWGGVLLHPDGSILALDQGVVGPLAEPRKLIRVDPATGAHTVLTTFDLPSRPLGLAVESNGTILVADADAFDGTGGVRRVNPASGEKSVLSAGGFFRDPWGVAVEADGSVLVSDGDAFNGDGGVIRVDPLSGAQTKVSTGGLFRGALTIALMPEGVGRHDEEPI